MSIVYEPMFGFLAVELAIVFCSSSLINIPAAGQLRGPECPLCQYTWWAARLATSGSQLLGLIWAVEVKHSQPKPSRLAPSPQRNGNIHIQISVQWQGLRKQGFCQGQSVFISEQSHASLWTMKPCKLSTLFMNFHFCAFKFI